MVVCVALATLLAKTPRREGSMGYTRLGPIAQALQEALDKEADQSETLGQPPSSPQATGADDGGRIDSG
jgi:hypothetical protein